MFLDKQKLNQKKANKGLGFGIPVCVTLLVCCFNHLQVFQLGSHVHTHLVSSTRNLGVKRSALLAPLLQLY
jgi:hypothetical protein